MRVEAFTDPVTGLRDWMLLPDANTPRAARPRWILVFLIFVVGFLFGAATASAAEPCVGLKVRPSVMMASPWAKYDITAEIRVRRHADHRQLLIEWSRDGVHDGSSGPRQLEGAGAPFLHTLGPLRDKPGGHYEFIATVYNQMGKVVGRDRARILTPSHELEP